MMTMDTESWARLMGVMSMLALPPVRCGGVERRRIVEIELSPGVWQCVDGVSITSDSITFFSMNGVRHEWKFTTGEPTPRWRVDHGLVPFQIRYADGSR
jgi:hypothetical protein